MTKRTTLAEYQQVAQAVIDFITTKNGSVTATEIEQHFSSDVLPISVGRVTLNLIADRVLYFTEDRKIMKSCTLL